MHLLLPGTSHPALGQQEVVLEEVQVLLGRKDRELEVVVDRKCWENLCKILKVEV